MKFKISDMAGYVGKRLAQSAFKYGVKGGIKILREMLDDADAAIDDFITGNFTSKGDEGSNNLPPVEGDATDSGTPTGSKRVLRDRSK